MLSFFALDVLDEIWDILSKSLRVFPPTASCQPGSWVFRAFSDVEKPFLFSDLAVKFASQEIQKTF